MAATFALWETRSGNIINTYDTEHAALAVVREAIRRHGRGYAEGLALTRETSRSTKLLAQGAALAERALAAASSSNVAVPA